MSTELAKAMTDAGCTSLQIAFVEQALREQDLYVTVDWRAADRKRIEADAAARKAASASLPLYHGAIAQCQVQVYSNDRSMSFWRCHAKPIKVRRVKDDTGDGRLVVCGSHAKAGQIVRWRGETARWRGQSAPANEPVEEEYQP